MQLEGVAQADGAAHDAGAELQSPHPSPLTEEGRIQNVPQRLVSDEGNHTAAWADRTEGLSELWGLWGHLSHRDLVHPCLGQCTTQVPLPLGSGWAAALPGHEDICVPP